MADNRRDFNEQEVPFFARYLEAQITQDISEEDAQKVKGGFGQSIQTVKHPGDVDEVGAHRNSPRDIVTHKYPSDDDDDHGITS
ncbi:MAG: microviridin/marinostatin family tricyclic proteinase inhibitor [Leptolyngbya sp. SIO1E4]|nr:microviridin/marinostatin family tricyclic proteinase inhibitor [Leptolyngbya sp. SIO1E4]